MPNQDQDSFRQHVIDALPKLDEIAQDGIRAEEAPGVAIAPARSRDHSSRKKEAIDIGDP